MFPRPIAAAAVTSGQPLAAPPSAPFDAMRRMALFMGLALVFLRFSMLHQIQSYTMCFNLRLLYIFGIPAMLGAVAAGGLRRSFRSRPTAYWMLFIVWLVLATLFSSWRGGSAALLYGYLRTTVPVLFVMAGLVVTWSECRALMRVIAWAGLVSIAAARMFVHDTRSRLGLEFGTISDSNDLAAHMLLVAPFLLWLALISKLSLFRLAALAGVGYAVFVVLSTGSRGGFVGLAAGVLLYWVLGTARRRLALALLFPLALAAFLAVVPVSSLQRLTAFSGEERMEALESREIREHLLRLAVRYSVTRPLFGVGPGQFGNYSGMQTRTEGSRGIWFNTHNTWLQVSSECGLPAFLFFMAALGGSFRLLIGTYRQAGSRPEYAEIRTTAACILVGFGAFCVTITFLSFAYFFYLPAMSGLAISIWHGAREEIRLTDLAEAENPPPGAASVSAPGW